MSKKHKSKSLHKQIQEILVAKQRFGASKLEAKKNRESEPWIYSFSTYKTYRKHCLLFASWLKREHPECRSIKRAREYVNDYMDYRVSQGLSAWTLSLDYSSLVKLYDIPMDAPDRYPLPKRKRIDIKRSRGTSSRAQEYSPLTNEKLISFCCGTGCRHSELLTLHGDDLYPRERIEQELRRLELFSDELKGADKLWFITLKKTRDYNRGEHYFIRIKGKGGKTRLAVVLPRYEDAVLSCFDGKKIDDRIWFRVNTKIDYHKLRAGYATELYMKYERPLDEIKFSAISRDGRRLKSDIYYCRGDERGKWFDKQAIALVSCALGHSRIDTAITNYIR